MVFFYDFPHIQKNYKINRGKFIVTDIAILGCGMTGMMTALAFANSGIKTSIIEQSTSEEFPLDVRTTTFNVASRHFFDKVGIWPLFAKEVGELKEIYIVDNKSPRMLHLDSLDGKSKGYVIPNMFIKESLYKAVKENPMIKLMKGVDYDIPYQENGKVIINEKISSDILLVCEGRNSKLKEIFPAKIDKSYGQSALSFVVEHEKPHEGTAVEHFFTPGPFATLPMRAPCKSSIVWTESNEAANLFANLPKKELEMHLQERMGEFLGNVKIISDVQKFHLTARITKKYYQGNIILLGDSAHSIHPLAGQGLNQSIKDIDSIVSILTKRLQLGLELDTIAYAEYEKSRSRDNFTMFLITDNLNRIFSNNIFPFASLRKLGLSIQNEFPILKKFSYEYGSGVK
jgi:2-octaprenyl-6-methoxyphenol hydroxylase